MKRKLMVYISVLCLLLMAMPTSVFAASTYDVTFRAGQYGTFSDGSSKMVFKVTAGEAFPDTDTDSYIGNVSDGYFFKGWSASYDFPETVTKKQEYVAKYGKIVNAIEYTVKYVDADGVEIATRSTEVTDSSVSRTVRPLQITGYTANEESAELSSSNPTVTFTYTRIITENEEVVYGPNQTVTETEVVVVPGTTTNTGETTTTTQTGTTGTTAGTTTTTGEAGTTGATGATGTTTTNDATANDGTDTTTANTTQIADGQVPLADGSNLAGQDNTTGNEMTTLEDGQVPLSSMSQEEGSNGLLIAAIAAAVVAALGALVWFIILAKKKKESNEVK